MASLTAKQYKQTQILINDILGAAYALRGEQAVQELTNCADYVRSMNGRRENPSTPHRHKCPNPDCNFIWHHDPKKIPLTYGPNDNPSFAELMELDKRTDTAHYRAHTCPLCHAEQFRTYNGNEVPLLCNWDGR